MMSRISSYLTSLLWGFSEAVFFFLVPDIWLSRQVITDARAALIGIALATLGALTGGLLLYSAASQSPETVWFWIDLIPGISGSMVTDSGNDIKQDGLWMSLLVGMASGVPYKIYATWAGDLSLPLITFISATVCIRALRFSIVTGLAYGINYALKSKYSINIRLVIHGAAWIIFYVIYFYKFGA